MTNVYICTGTCGGMAAQEKYNAGARTCGAESCNRKGQPLEKRVQCAGCENAGPDHFCGKCTT